MRINPTRLWYTESSHPLALLLRPFSSMFGFIVSARRLLYSSGLKKSYSFPIPVIIVGNLTVGGTGKTPFVIWLAGFLKSQGYKPGIISRGYGGRYTGTHWVEPEDEAKRVGDEALLLVRHTQCPMVISKRKVDAVRELLTHSSCDVVIADDGLQHYQLGRELEIAIIDGKRRLGNQLLLPAGPLREPASRLHTVDFVVVNGGSEQDQFKFDLIPSKLVSLADKTSQHLADFPARKVHAVAGIGHPERFFNTLQQAGFTIIPHVFPDHHRYRPQALAFKDELPIIMTEKDAVKCAAFPDRSRYWYLQVDAHVNPEFEQHLLEKLSCKEAIYVENAVSSTTCRGA